MDDPDLYEGDMLLTAEQRMAAEMGLDVDDPMGRGATKGRQWPGGVMAYVIDSSLCKFTVISLLTKTAQLKLQFLLPQSVGKRCNQRQAMAWRCDGLCH